MTRYVFDTSALLKRYHAEQGSSEVDVILSEHGARFLISWLAIVESVSAFCVKARSGEIDVERFDIEDDGGIIGYVVSKDFEGLTSIDRQTLIHKALRSGRQALSRAEVKRIDAIASLTPIEFEVWSA